MVVLGALFWAMEASDGALDRAVAASKILQYTVASIGAVGAVGIAGPVPSRCEIS